MNIGSGEASPRPGRRGEAGNERVGRRGLSADEGDRKPRQQIEQLTEAGSAALRSFAVEGRIFRPSPMYHGTTFHVTVLRRSSPADSLSKKKFFAVSSGLLREANPEATAFGLGASSKNRHAASAPPSSGSKKGI